MAEERSAEEGRRLVLGLGNPGSDYRGTRHNLGFCVLDSLAKAAALRTRAVECNSLVASSEEMMLAWPQTYMNRSGYAARCLFERHGFLPQELLVVYDDSALPLGALRMRSGGSAGGHRGMESVIHNLRTDEIARLRLGIAPAEGFTSDEDLSQFVLSEFAQSELEVVMKNIPELIAMAKVAARCRDDTVSGPPAIRACADSLGSGELRLSARKVALTTA